MFDRAGLTQPPQGADVIARAVGALALAALAVIHVVDLPTTLGPAPLVGIGYVGIIAAAVLVGGVMITRSHWLTWAAAGGLLPDTPEGARRCACPSRARPATRTRPRGGDGCSRWLSRPAWWRCWPSRAALPR